MIRQNRLLAALEHSDQEVLVPLLEDIDLPRGLELSVPRTPAIYCYFPAAGIISTVVVSPDGRQTEIGVVGREGMSPASAILGSDQAPFRTVMQVEGRGWRMKREDLQPLIEQRPGVRRILLRWVQAFSLQIAYTALSHAAHSVDERLARWLLLCHDRVDGDSLALTHEFLSVMLAVRRPSVTNALHVLEGRGFILSRRGTVIMRDRAALENFAADCYGGSEREYERLLSAKT